MFDEMLANPITKSGPKMYKQSYPGRGKEQKVWLDKTLQKRAESVNIADKVLSGGLSGRIKVRGDKMYRDTGMRAVSKYKSVCASVE